MLKKLFLLVSILVIPAFADYKTEINHLLNYTKNSHCTYIRNGKGHTSLEGEQHIQKKYEHYKNDIKSAEDFIRLSATKSMMTGNKYYIQCKGSPKIESSKWLLEELEKYRKK